MKATNLLPAILFAGLISAACAQNVSVDWYKVSGGGGTSTNGNFSVSGTIGQHDASGALSCGNYSVTGGFWSLISVVQTPGAPVLFIAPNGPDSVKVFWAGTGNYTLQQSSNLAGGVWSATGYAITNGFCTNFCTVTPLTDKLFFRLSNP